MSWIHPTLFFFVAAAILPFVKGTARKAVLLGAPLLAFLSLLIFPEGTYGTIALMGQSLTFGRVDKLSLVFGYAFTFIAFAGMLYALHVKEDREHVATFLYIGSSLGATFAGDLFTLFIFWELMAFSSVFLIWFGRNVGTFGRALTNPKSAGAGFRYLLMHALGGVLLLGGIVIHIIQGGGTAFGALPHGGWAGSLILLGFLVNVGAPPLHAWLPDGYPEASVTGTVFLSAFTTKVAVYALARGFAGTELLIYLGVFMTLFGIGYTIIENDIRRLLSYHIISQVGYMVAGIGIGTELAVNGAVAHAFNNILYKSLLIMGMGAVLYMTGRRKGTELGGLYKTMPLTFLLYMVGGFSISGVPLFNGFISKAMVISASAEAHRGIVNLLLLMAAAGTFLSTTLKLPYVVFFGDDKGLPAQDPPKNMLWGMALTGLSCILFGSVPALMEHILPFPVEYHAYTPDHLVSQFQILFFAFLGFLLYLKKLHPEQSVSLDADWLYRRGAQGFMKVANGPVAAYEGAVTELYRTAIVGPAKRFVALCRRFDTEVIDGAVNGVGRGIFGGSWFSNAFENYVVYGFINMTGYANHLAARIFRRLQTGSVHNYAMIIIIGIFMLVNLYILFGNQLPASLVAWK